MSLLTTSLPPPAEDGGPGTTGDGYAQFYASVGQRQLIEWLPTQPSLIVDLSGSDGRYAADAARFGHTVVYADQSPLGERRVPRPRADGRVHVVRADGPDTGWLRDGVADAVLAEGSTLSACLATDHTVADIARVLRPGGRLLLSVDSLMLGLARLAEQARWAELADVPAADVVLVPAEDGSITRCFWPEQLAEVLVDNGFDVEWIRPRTVLSPETVKRALAGNPAALDTLVDTELALERDREGEPVGFHLVAAGVRR